MTQLNLIWHMHQPDYRLPGNPEPLLPWVRLHAVRGYNDLASVLERCPSLRCTVNFSGILLQQLREYTPEVRDAYARLSLIPAGDLSAEQREFVVSRFFSANFETLVARHSRYAELHAKRGTSWKEDTAKAVSHFTDQDITDLQAWFNLAWIGFDGCRNGAVQQLMAKGRGFSYDDVGSILQLHDDMVAGVLPRYRRLADSGTAELTFTPYHHPILPLLCDLRREGRQSEGDPLPEFLFHQDALEHIQRGRTLYAQAFGRAPTGVWPAEGAVSNTALSLLARAGLRWTATDQANLGRGEPLSHLTPWRWRKEGDTILMFFRDLRLADNIGFTYAKWEAMQAAHHFVGMVQSLGEQASFDRPVVTVALDGENPWEYYADGGAAFLTALGQLLEDRQDLQCTTPSELLELRDYPELETVRSGSWVGGSFDIWSRHPETRQAWRLLAAARRDLDTHASGAVLDELLAAEGSDWFWWYGDDFVSEGKQSFDQLFRSHLIAAYEYAGEVVPEALYIPIGGLGDTSAPVVTSLFQPTLDGRSTTYFEWLGAAQIDAGAGQGAMAAGSSAIARMLYGYSATELWIRLDLESPWLEGLRNSGGLIRLCLLQEGKGWCMEFEVKPGLTRADGDDVAVDELAELKIELKVIPIDTGLAASIRVELELTAGETAHFPLAGSAPISFPDRDSTVSSWLV